MSFILHWTTYFLTTLAQTIQLVIFVAATLEPVSVEEEFAVADRLAVVVREVADAEIGGLMILEAVPRVPAEPEIMLKPLLEGVAEGLLEGLFGFEPLLEVVEWMADEQEFKLVMGDPLEELRPVMMVELNFVRHAVPDLTLEQKRKVWNAAEACLKQSADRTAERNHLAVGLMGFMPATPVTPRESLSQAISGELKQILSPDRFERFAETADKRQLRRKTAAILGIVSRLDGELYLSQSQREQLIDAISSNCGTGWINRADTLDWQEDPLDGIPEAVIASCLNEAQQSAWKSLQESQIFEMISVGEFEHVDDGWWSAPGPLDELGVPQVVPNEESIKAF